MRIVDKRRLEVDVKSDSTEPSSVKSVREMYAMELPEDAAFDLDKAPQAKLSHGELKFDIPRRERTVVEVPVIEG